MTKNHVSLLQVPLAHLVRAAGLYPARAGFESWRAYQK